MWYRVFIISHIVLLLGFLSLLRAILATAVVLIAALGATLIMMALIWLIGNYSVDRLIAVAGLLVGTAPFLYTIIVSLWRRR